MSVKPAHNPSALCSAKWITVESLEGTKKEIVIYTWSDGFMGPTHTGIISTNDKIHLLAENMATKQNIPIISEEISLIVFDYHKKKWTALLAPANSEAFPITQAHSSFRKCARNAALIAGALKAQTLVTDKSGRVQVFQFPTFCR